MIGHEQSVGTALVELELGSGLSESGLLGPEIGRVVVVGIEDWSEVGLVVGTVAASVPAQEPEKIPEVGVALHEPQAAAAFGVQLIADKDNIAGKLVDKGHILHTADSNADTAADTIGLE